MASKFFWVPSCIVNVQDESMAFQVVSAPRRSNAIDRSRVVTPKWRPSTMPFSVRVENELAARSFVQTRGKLSQRGGPDTSATAAMKNLEQPFESYESSRLVSTIGTEHTSPASMRNGTLTDQHLMALIVVACMTGGAVTALFIAAIPTLLAFKKAAESLEKLLDITREELPGTMTAVRLSGMEISDLTVELSELGQEITEGVRSSARAVRAAEDGLRRMSSLTSTGAHDSPNRVSETSHGSGSKESSRKAGTST